MVRQGQVGLPLCWRAPGANSRINLVGPAHDNRCGRWIDFIILSNDKEIGEGQEGMEGLVGLHEKIGGGRERGRGTRRPKGAGKLEEEKEVVVVEGRLWPSGLSSTKYDDAGEEGKRKRKRKRKKRK